MSSPLFSRTAQHRQEGEWHSLGDTSLASVHLIQPASLELAFYQLQHFFKLFVVWYNIRYKVIKKLEQLKLEGIRLKEKWQNLLQSQMFILEHIIKEYWKTKPRTKPLPNAADFSTMEPFYSLIFKSPSDNVLNKSHFTKYQAELTDICNKWMKSSSELLVRLLPNSPKVRSHPDLNLAMFFFWCHWCQETISYPRVLAHKCLTRNHSSNKQHDELLEASHLNAPWNYGGEQVTFNEGHICAREIISICGQDADSLTPSPCLKWMTLIIGLSAFIVPILLGDDSLWSGKQWYIWSCRQNCINQTWLADLAWSH